MKVGVIANRLEQGVATRGLSYGLELTEQYFPKLPHLTLGFGGGNYGDLPRYALQADYLLYQVGVSQDFDLVGDLTLSGNLRATFWDDQMKSPVGSQRDLWGWEGTLDLGYRSWNLWLEHRLLEELQLTSVGVSYTLGFNAF
ncbi:MAG: hypothetical protein AAFQ98_14915 [Bacteroidota bacterium]